MSDNTLAAISIVASFLFWAFIIYRGSWRRKP